MERRKLARAVCSVNTQGLSLFVCASSVVGGYGGGGDPRFVAPQAGDRYLGRATAFTPVARSGIIAALDVTNNRIVWPSGPSSATATLATGGGLLFVGRNDGRLTALDSATGRQVCHGADGKGGHGGGRRSSPRSPLSRFAT
jgi:quinohemoprotein ethanol dehydrogenase